MSLFTPARNLYFVIAILLTNGKHCKKLLHTKPNLKQSATDTK